MKMPQKIVTIEPELCIGCKQCAMNCSYEHEGIYSKSYARIKLVTFEEKCLTVPVTCAYCDEALCEKVCPTGAMTHDKETGAAKVIENLCIGCKECANICPIGAIDFHPVKKVAMRCDLCGGEPKCVVNCPKGALQYEDINASMRNKRRKRVINQNIDRSMEV
jgi:Fe-S-cluster-containing hydrogenase component 2